MILDEVEGAMEVADELFDDALEAVHLNQSSGKAGIRKWPLNEGLSHYVSLN
ncbi:hypothetical protein [Peribacillus muralis]|uniref:hypothetical protein n=1 Tax=Peribacillus muralis TaxID=264697 RepID=UPI003D0566F3